MFEVNLFWRLSCGQNWEEKACVEVCDKSLTLNQFVLISPSCSYTQVTILAVSATERKLQPVSKTHSSASDVLAIRELELLAF